jgi:hypothetical protein
MRVSSPTWSFLRQRVAPGEAKRVGPPCATCSRQSARAAHIPLPLGSVANRFRGRGPRCGDSQGRGRRPLHRRRLQLSGALGARLRGTLVFISGTSNRTGPGLVARASPEAQICEPRRLFVPATHPFTARAACARAKFKVYELLLRARASAHQRTPRLLQGRYGALPVVSVRGRSGCGETLAGASAPQGPRIVVMDAGGCANPDLCAHGCLVRALRRARAPETVEVSHATSGGLSSTIYCEHRCTYCDFALTTHGMRLPERFTSALLSELALRAPAAPGRIGFYVGGGTRPLARGCARASWRNCGQARGSRRTPRSRSGEPRAGDRGVARRRPRARREPDLTRRQAPDEAPPSSSGATDARAEAALDRLARPRA